MLRRLVIVAVVAALALLALRGTWALHVSGMLGSCTAYAPEPDGGQQVQCKAGVLDGIPDMTGKGCTLQVTGGKVQYWTCPAPIASTRAGL